MKVINLVGDRMFLDYLITQYFPYVYENDTLQVTYESHLETADIDARIEQLELQQQTQQEDNDTTDTMDLQTAITILKDLRAKL
jgi:hypothetical protein